MRITVYQEQQACEFGFCVSNANWEKFLRYLRREIPRLSITSHTLPGLADLLKASTEKTLHNTSATVATQPEAEPARTPEELEHGITLMHALVTASEKKTGKPVHWPPMTDQEIDLFEDLYPDPRARYGLMYGHIHYCLSALMVQSKSLNRALRLEYDVEPMRRTPRRSKQRQPIKEPPIDYGIDDGSEAVA